MTPPAVCLVTADSVQARLYLLDDSSTDAPGATLRERVWLTSTSNTEHPCDQRFAADVVAEVAQVIGATGCRSVLVAASGDMLVLLRALLSALTARGVSLVTVPRDLVHESAVDVHDHLAMLGLVPARPAERA